MAATRTFVGFAIPEPQRLKLARLQALLAPEVPGARWVEPAMFHATLAFLGDVPDPGLADVCRAVADGSAGFGRLTLNLQGLGAFPDPTRPRVAWVGLVGPGIEALGELRRSIARGVAEAEYPPEDDRFSPHVTLAYLKPRRGTVVDLSKAVAHYRTWAAGHFHVDTITTYASTVTPEGRAYMPLASAPLRGRDR